MALVTINCLCGKMFQKEIIGEGKIICKNCNRVYLRVFKDEKYIIKLSKNQRS